MSANTAAVEPQNSAEYEPQWSTWARQVVIIGLLIAAVYALVLLAPVMKLLSMTFLLSLLMFAPSRLLARYLPVSYGLAVMLCYGLVILLFAGALLIFVPSAVEAGNNLRREAEQYSAQLQQSLESYTTADGFVTLAGLRIDLNPLIEPLRNLALGASENTGSNTSLVGSGDLQQAVTNAAAVLTPIISGITLSLSTSLMAFFISFLVLLDLPHLERAVLAAIAPAYQHEFALLARDVGRVWKGFFRGQALVSLIVACLTWLQLALMGAHNAVVVAVVSGVISLIPNIGSVLALVPVAATSLLQGSSIFTGLSNVAFAALVVVVNLIITQVVYNVAAPKIIGDAVHLPIPVIIVGVFLGAALGGVLGAFLVTPIIATIRVIVAYLLKKIGRQDPFPGQQLTTEINKTSKSSI
jgi:predicted PurR-regulated permease PerM